MDKTITKEKAIALFGTQAALARALGIQRQAVCKWRDGEPIPELQYMKLRYEVLPELFRESA